MNGDSDEIAKSASEEYTYSGYASAVTLPPQREALMERDYRVLFEILPQGILCQDRAGRIVMANPAAQQILGLSLDELRGRTVFDKNWQLIREDGLPFPISDHPAIQALRSGEPAPPMLMGIFNPREHAYRWIQVSAVPQIRPGESAPSLIYTVFHDQTQHKERQDLLRASEQRARARVAELEAAFQAIAEHVVIYDRYGHVLQTSEGMRKLLDIEQASNFMQKSLHDRSSTVSIRGEDGYPLPEEQWPVRRILNGEVLRDATAVDFIVRHPDGSDCQISVNGAPMLDDAGQITGAVAIFQDVTERRNLERRTQRSLDALLAMIEAMVREQQESEPLDDEDLAVSGAPQTALETQPATHSSRRRLAEHPSRLPGCQRMAILMVDAHTDMLQPMVIVGSSPEHELHWRNSLQGARLSNLLGDAKLVARLRAGEELSLDIAHPLFRDQPSYKLVMPILNGSVLNGVLLLDYGANQPHCTSYELATIHAIAELALLLLERALAQHERDRALVELKAAQDELEYANKRKSDLVSLVSHEFRTALTGIQGFSELMRDETLSMMEMKEFATDIHADARRLVRMITEMLDLERVDVGRMQLNLSWLELNAIIINVTGHISSLTTHHTIRPQLASALPVLLGDYEKLTLVVSNLLQNAVKYSPNGGEIIVSSYIEGHMVHVSVRDYGVGIFPTDLERIFERYAHVEMNSLRSSEETGLSLPIVREIVQLHGGQVWAESVVGKGSIFHFTVRFTDSRL